MEKRRNLVNELALIGRLGAETVDHKRYLEVAGNGDYGIGEDGMVARDIVGVNHVCPSFLGAG